MKPYAPYNAKIALSNQVKTDLLINIYQKNYYLENERFSTVDIKNQNADLLKFVENTRGLQSFLTLYLVTILTATLQ
jgi:hypothetical protein